MMMMIRKKKKEREREGGSFFFERGNDVPFSNAATLKSVDPPFQTLTTQTSFKRKC
jgi:hypothetical protein